MISTAASIDLNIDPVLHVGGLGISWYGIFFALALAAAIYAGALPHLRRRGLDVETVERYAVISTVAGLIGARLAYMVQNSPPPGGSWLSHPQEIIAVWHGGLDLAGALLAAPLALALLARHEKRNWWLLADAAAIAALIGQPIGRLGNVINGDVLGGDSGLPWAVAYSHPDAGLPAGFLNCSLSRQFNESCHTYQPAALYEALAALLILAALLVVRARWSPRPGALWLGFLGLFAVTEFVVGFARASDPVVALRLNEAQWVAIVVGVAALPLLVDLWRRGYLDWSAAVPGPALEPAGPVAGPAPPPTSVAPAAHSAGVTAASARGARPAAPAAAPARRSSTSLGSRGAHPAGAAPASPASRRRVAPAAGTTEVPTGAPPAPRPTAPRRAAAPGSGAGAPPARRRPPATTAAPATGSVDAPPADGAPPAPPAAVPVRRRRSSSPPAQADPPATPSPDPTTRERPAPRSGDG